MNKTTRATFEQGAGVLRLLPIFGPRRFGRSFSSEVSPQNVTLKPGWNRLFLRVYAVGYTLCFGVVLNGQPEQLWRLRLATMPPDGRHEK